jgi:hypothetical protein
LLEKEKVRGMMEKKTDANWGCWNLERLSVCEVVFGVGGVCDELQHRVPLGVHGRGERRA